MNIGITGSSGFIGKNLVKSLKSEKINKIEEFDLPKKNLLEKNSIKNFLKDKDIVIHTAAVNKGSDDEIISGSIVATYNLLSAMIESNSRSRLIFLSSIHAEAKKKSTYGLSKNLTEVMIKSFSEKYKIPVTIFRVPNVFGENCNPFYNSVVSTFCYQIVKNKKITITPGSKKINLIYIQDLIAILLDETHKKRKGLFYLKKITTNNHITIRNLAEVLKSFKKQKNIKIKSTFQKNLYTTFLFYNEQKTKD